ncbi:MAG TPA: TrkA family potassium uptake protein [Magnetospirillaceae bacterium]|nr:TrkA family potassium uptake protein [Magnetospirillaceae bacterium]
MCATRNDARLMNYLIVGCGRVGSTLAKRLARAGHDVTVVDENSAAFKRLGRDFPGKMVLGTGIDVDVLCRAGIERADGMAVCTQGDNRNIMAALIAKHHFKVRTVVARIYDPMRAAMYRDFGVLTICPTTVGAHQMANALLQETYRKLPYERHDVEVVEFLVTDDLAGLTVDDLTLPGKTRASIVVRNGSSLIPSGDLRLRGGDRVVAIVAPDAEPEFRKLITPSLAAR